MNLNYLKKNIVWIILFILVLILVLYWMQKKSCKSREGFEDTYVLPGSNAESIGTIDIVDIPAITTPPQIGRAHV